MQFPYLHNYLSLINCCRVTAKLRYYPKEYVQELMAQAMGFLLRTRTAPFEQLDKGTRLIYEFCSNFFIEKVMNTDTVDKEST